VNNLQEIHQTTIVEENEIVQASERPLNDVLEERKVNHEYNSAVPDKKGKKRFNDRSQ
jgi:hypothetical protein